MSEWLEYEVTWTDPDGSINVYQARGHDLIAETDALVRARTVLERDPTFRPADVVIRHRTVVSQTGPWVSQGVDLSVVGPALERVKATARLMPSRFKDASPIRMMRDGSQQYGPYGSEDEDA